MPNSNRILAVLAAAGLLGVAVVHVIDGPGSLTDTPYVGVLELALAALAVPVAVMLVVQPLRALWRVAGVATVAALAAYLLSRTVGLPDATDDVGNWSQTLGVVSVVIEAAVLGIVAVALRRRA